MKKLLLTLLVLVSLSVSAQSKYFTKTGITDFKASVEAFEPVEATNKSTTVILNTSNGDIAALLFVKAFHFEIALMEEHFNENYMDSDKFPKATFKGNIDGFDIDKLSNKVTALNLKGILNIRGKEKAIETIANLSREDGKIMLVANFSVAPQDFDTDIPKIVRKKIAEQININLNYELVQKN
jgi:hypothetical protein